MNITTNQNAYDEILLLLAKVKSFKDSLSESQIATIKHNIILMMGIDDDDVGFVWTTEAYAKAKKLNIVYANGIAYFNSGL